MTNVQNPIWATQYLLTKLTVAIIVVSCSSLAVKSHAAEDRIYQPFDSWNGKKIYLSPARHDPENIGCDNFEENRNAMTTAFRTANANFHWEKPNNKSRYRNLRARGYMVRIGRGTLSDAIKNSNTWGADIHVPIHSNATTKFDCEENDANYGGTLVIFKSYGDKGGEGLSELLIDKFGPVSPGSHDWVCDHNIQPCTRFDCPGELCNTKAVAAYLEREYHTWDKGVDFMKNDFQSTWRIGWAIDSYFAQFLPPRVQ